MGLLKHEETNGFTQISIEQSCSQYKERLSRPAKSILNENRERIRMPC